MPAATRLGDANTGHDACPPAALAGGSPNVFINGKSAGREGDSYAPHGCKDHPPHAGTISSGAAHVFINGMKAARVGDSVSCGGTVAEGSANVIIGDKGGENDGYKYAFEASAACVHDRIKVKQYINNQRLLDPAIRNEELLDCLVKESQYKTDDFLLHMPEISEAIAERDFKNSPKDKTGFIYLSEQFRRWFSGKAANADINEAPYLIQLEWVRQFEKAENVYQELVKNFLSDAGQKLLLKRLRQTNLLPLEVNETKSFDFTQYDPSLTVDGKLPVNQYDFYEKLYTNSRSVERDYSGDFLQWGKNGLMAGLGSFMLRALPKGTVTKASDGTYTVNVTGMSVYVSDSFDFTDNKEYGFWSYTKKDFLDLPVGDYDVNVTDRLFKNFRATYNKGRDFYVFSDPKDADGFTATQFSTSE